MGVKKSLKIFAVLLTTAILLTLSSYFVVTGHNVHLGQFESTTLTGEYIVDLPCAPNNDSGWVSNDPVLPETRGLPINYHHWNPCEGNTILRNGFILDVGFWFTVSTFVLLAYRLLIQYKAK